ncbi:porin [Rhodoligotrophos ferricapiens]|uniref:porin n=1 Tax=Rhodoligotrophos ferricapiens TaxID=3069264 RepID=UPI00315C7FF9
MSILRFHAALSGGIALAALLLTPVQADELSQLKSELQRLQEQVDRLESRQADVPTPSSPSSIVFVQGSGATSSWRTDRAGDVMPADRGFTIAISPSADLPSPIHEVTISGYVKGDVIYDFDEDLGDAFYYERIGKGGGGHVRLHARQSRFSIKSRSDTAVGQVRTLIEGDFFGGDSTDFRLRHAWGEWDATPELTLGAGQYWRNFMSPFVGVTTVDFNGDVGLIGTSRNAQFRLTWVNGPTTAALSVERPTSASDIVAYGADLDAKSISRPDGATDNAPDVSARVQYELPGGNQIMFSGMLRNYRVDGVAGQGGDEALGWGVQGAVNVAIAEPIILTASAMYGKGLGNYVLGSQFGAYAKNGKVELVEQLGLFGGAIVTLTDTTTFNLGVGYLDQNDKDILNAGVKNASVDVLSAHANIIWQPVSQLRLGAEVMWAERERIDMAGKKGRDDAWRGQIGAWFFF